MARHDSGNQIDAPRRRGKGVRPWPRSRAGLADVVRALSVGIGPARFVASQVCVPVRPALLSPDTSVEQGSQPRAGEKPALVSVSALGDRAPTPTSVVPKATTYRIVSATRLAKKFEGAQWGSLLSVSDSELTTTRELLTYVPVSASAFGADSRLMALGGLDHTLGLWDTELLTRTALFEGHQGPIRGSAISPNGEQLVTASEDRTARLWNLKTGALAHVLNGHDDWVVCCAISRDARILTGSHDATLRLWTGDSGTCIAIFEGHSDWVTCCAFSDDGRYAVSGSRDCTLLIWDVTSGACLRTFRGHDAGISALAIIDHSSFVSGSNDGTLRVWDMPSGACLRVFRGHTDWVTTLAVNGRDRIVSAGQDKTLRIWQLSTGELIDTLQRTSVASGCAFADDDASVIVVDEPQALTSFRERLSATQSEPYTAVQLEPGTDEVEAADSTVEIAASDPSAARSPEDLCAWSSLWPRLERVLGRKAVTRRPDVERMVRQLSRGLPVARVPMRTQRRLPFRLALVVDRRTRLIPYWHDQDRVRSAIITKLGAGRVHTVWRTDAGVVRRSRDLSVDAILVLGHETTTEEIAELYARGVKAQGARGLARIALTPLLGSRLATRPAKGWMLIPWELPRAMARVDGSVASATEELLRAVSPAIRVEPGLLRALRRSLFSWMESGVEADVWAHEAVNVRCAVGFNLHSESLGRLREELRKLGDPNLYAEIEAVLRRWHAQLPPEVLLQELAGLVPPELRGLVPRGLAQRTKQAEVRLCRVLRKCHEVGPLRDFAAAAWFRREANRIPSWLWSNGGAISVALSRAWTRTEFLAANREQRPAGLVLTPAEHADGQELPPWPRRLGLWQEDQWFDIRPSHETPAASEASTFLGTLEAGTPLILLDGHEGQDKLEVPLVNYRARFRSPLIPFTLLTDNARYELAIHPLSDQPNPQERWLAPEPSLPEETVLGQWKRVD